MSKSVQISIALPFGAYIKLEQIVASSSAGKEITNISQLIEEFIWKGMSQYLTAPPYISTSKAFSGILPPR